MHREIDQRAMEIVNENLCVPDLIGEDQKYASLGDCLLDLNKSVTRDLVQLRTDQN